MIYDPTHRSLTELIEDPQNALVERALDEGRRAIGYTCSYIPEPLLSLDGLLPLRLRAPRVFGTPMADTYLSNVICTYCRSLLELALEGRYDFLTGWVLGASCDHVRRLFDNLEYLNRPAFLHILDIPHKTGDPALEWYIEELEKLRLALADHFQVDTGRSALTSAIGLHNAHLERIRRLSALRKRSSPPLSGTTFHKVLVACGMAPKDMLAQRLEELAQQLEDDDGIQNARARLFVVGSQLDDPAFIETIESMGGLVVADRFCVGSLPGLEPIDDSDDPLRSLAEYSLRKTRCPRMVDEFNQRLADIEDIVGDYQVDGIILQTMKFCDLWGVEAGPLYEALRKQGIPVLRLEREYTFSSEGQIRTRIQAFLESMGR